MFQTMPKIGADSHNKVHFANSHSETKFKHAHNHWVSDSPLERPFDLHSTLPRPTFKERLAITPMTNDENRRTLAMIEKLSSLDKSKKYKHLNLIPTI